MDTRPQRATLEIPGIVGLEAFGRGGFATVYRGWQPALRREVAVKVLDAPALDAASARRFEREAMAMGSLSGHPNVVPVYDVGEVAGRPYLVMPLLRAGSLEDELARGPLPPEEVVRLGQGVADALSAAHAAGVLHRDVKPANVLRTSHGAPQLADFGVAQVADTTQTLGGDLVATVAYAAPEVLEGAPATEASDVYSLGATLHAAARGEAPYVAGPDDSPMSLAVRVMTAEPADLRGAGVPAELAAVIDRAMARDPAERYPSAAALRRALDDLALSEGAEGATVAEPVAEPTLVVPAAMPIPAPPADVRHFGPAPSRGRRRTWLIIGLLALALVAAGVLTDRLIGDDPERAAPSTSTQAAPTTTTTAPADPTTTTAPRTIPAPTPTTTEAAPTTTTTSPVSSGVGPGPVDATRQYYALMDAGRIDEGWASLSPAYQARTGEESYRAFWSSIAGVEVLEATADGELGARARLRYTRSDGTTSTENVFLRFVSGDDGRLLVDDYGFA